MSESLLNLWPQLIDLVLGLRSERRLALPLRCRCTRDALDLSRLHGGARQAE